MANRRLAGRRIVPKVRVVDRHVIVALPLGPQRLEVPAVARLGWLAKRITICTGRCS